MPPWLSFISAIICAVLASSGMWALLQKRMDKKDAKTRLLVGLAHDRIMFLGMTYIKRDYITQDEYENLHQYLWEPYHELGGNGSAERVMRAVDNIKIVPNNYKPTVDNK